MRGGWVEKAKALWIWWNRYSKALSDAVSMYIVLILYIISTPAFLSGCERPPVLKSRAMGYLVKIQKVDRPTNRSYYLNFPVALAEALIVKKGEKFEWLVEDKNTLLLLRLRRSKPRKLNQAKRNRQNRRP